MPLGVRVTCSRPPIIVSHAHPVPSAIPSEVATARTVSTANTMPTSKSGSNINSYSISAVSIVSAATAVAVVVIFVKIIRRKFKKKLQVLEHR